MPTIILSCHCPSSFQDRMYGTGKRVHNLCKRDNKLNNGARCTVCGAERATGIVQAVVAEKKK